MTARPVVHIVPLRDVIAHTVPGDPPRTPVFPGWWRAEAKSLPECMCGPSHQVIQGPRGRRVAIVHHHALDNRERTEQARESA